MTENFKIGDRVRCTWNHRDFSCKDKVGIIKVWSSIGIKLGVEFDENMGGHTLGERTVKNGHGLWVPEKYLVLLKKEMPRIPTHIVVWDTTCGDPSSLAYSEKEAKGKARELLDVRDVIKASIVIYEIKRMIRPQFNVVFKEVKSAAKKTGGKK